ncbi:MAG: acyl-CoA reductase [Gammaproteobacteria bacterium]
MEDKNKLRQEDVAMSQIYKSNTELNSNKHQKINLLFPVFGEQDPISLSETIVNNPISRPFSSITVNFISEFSRSILKSKKWREYPDVIALANWFRPKRLEYLKEIFLKNPDDIILRPRGVIFHVAPSNVDTIFLYSWLLSLLVGNINIVKVSSKQDGLTKLLTSTLDKLVKSKKEYTCIFDRNKIITYDNQKYINDIFSSICDLRVIWGGDTTVQTVRQSPLKPTGKDLTFPDRFSMGIINVEAYIESNEKEQNTLATNITKDITLFGQQACSSIRAIAWICKDENLIIKAQEHLWRNVYEKLKLNEGLNGGEIMERFISAVSFLSSIPSKPNSANGFTEFVYRIPIDNSKKAAENFRTWHSGNLLIGEIYLKDLDQLSTWLNIKTQTIASFGYDNKALKEFCMNLENSYIDRFVSYGSSLEFDHIWDSQDFLVSFSRATRVKL